MEAKNISLKVYKSEDKTQNVLITVHGFAGDKESSVIDAIGKEMIKYGYDVIAFDLPCHGDDKKTGVLKLKDCRKHLEMVEKYVKKEYPNVPISYFATSFGGYLLLQYLNKSKINYNKIILRAPAVYMAEVLREKILPEHNVELTDLKHIVNLGYGKELFVDYSFYKDLLKVKEKDLVSGEQLCIIQGKKDNIVEYKKNQQFFEKYYNNKHRFYYFENADHRFKNAGELEKIVEIAKEILM